MRRWKKWAGVVLSCAAAMSLALPVYAGEVGNNETKNTDVYARVASGGIDYVVVIPDKVDFGLLTAPQKDEDSFKDVKFEVTFKEARNLPENEMVGVALKSDAQQDGKFILRNTENTKTLGYDVYAYADPTNREAVNAGTPYTDGYYFFAGFTVPGQSHPGTLRLNERQMFDTTEGGTPVEYLGSYTGTLQFRTELKTIQ